MIYWQGEDILIRDMEGERIVFCGAVNSVE